MVGAGQKLTVDLKASNSQNYFHVMVAGSGNPLFIGTTSRNCFSGPLLIDGDVTVRVYLLQSAARRNETNTYSLRVSSAGIQLAPVPAYRDFVPPDTPFHASAEVPCGSGSSDKAARYEAFVIWRANNGASRGGRDKP